MFKTAEPRHNEQYDEGRAAAKAGQDFRDCPYTFANSGCSLADYEQGDWREKRNNWFHGWQDQRREIANSPLKRQLTP